MKKYLMMLVVLFLMLIFSIERVKAQRLIKHSLSDTLGSVDLGTGNKKDTDTLKVPLLGLAFDGYFEVLFKYDSSLTNDSSYTEAKLPSIMLEWGYMKSDSLVMIAPHPDSAYTDSSLTFNIVDSVKHYDKWERFEIEPDMTEGIVIIVAFSDEDTSQVHYQRKIDYDLELNIR